MKKYLKLLALFLCCALLATVIPTTLFAFAADEAATAPDNYKGVKYDDAALEEGGNWDAYDEYITKDRRLVNVYNKILGLDTGDSLNVAFLGGSITNGSTASNVDATSYRCLVGNAITDLVKEVHNDKTVVERVVTPYNVTAADYSSDVEGQITVNNLNSAYGATSSWNAVYRFKEDAGLDCGNENVKAPDLAFVEFAYNDMCAGDTGANRVYTDKDGNAAIACAAEYESIILQLIEANPKVQIIGLFTTGLNYYDYIDYEKYPALSAQRAVLRKYDIPYLYIGKELVEKIKAENPDITDNSQFKNVEGNAWRNYFEDQVHPGDAGHAFYAEKISAYIRERISAVADYSAYGDVSPLVRNYEDIVANGTYFDTSILKLNAKSDRIAELYADYLGDTEYVTGWRHYDWKYVDNAEAINNARHQSEENASFFTIKEGSTFAFRFTGTSVGIWYNGLANNVGKMQAYIFEVAEDGSKSLVDIVDSVKRTDTIPLCWRLLENAPEKTYEIRVTTAADVGTQCNIKRIFINGTDLTPVKHGLDVPKNLLGNAGFTQPIASNANGFDVEGNFVSIDTDSAKNTTGAYFYDASGRGLEGEKTAVIDYSKSGMRQMVELKNGMSYKLTLDYARNGEAATKARLQASLEYKDENGNFVTVDTAFIEADGLFTYKEYSANLTAKNIPENCKTYIKFNTVQETGKVASAYIDNVVLAETDLVVTDTTKELIADPGFEQGAFQNVAADDNNRYNGWANVSATSGGQGGNSDGAYIYTNSPLNLNVRTGDSALRLYSTKENWHTVNTYFIIEPGKTYEYSFYGRDDKNTCGVEINLRLKQYTTTYLLTENHTMTTAWTKYSGTFTAPSNAQDNTLFFAIKGTGGNIYIDDVSIKEVISIPSPEIIADPDFERNATGFVASGNETTGWYCPDLPNGGVGIAGKRAYYYPNANPTAMNCRQGTGALRLYLSGTSWHAANTHVILEPGKTYDYSFWARSGNANATVTLSISKMPYSYMVFEKQDTVTLTNAWVQYKGTFTAPSGSTDNKFYFAFGNVTVGDVFIDDVSLKLVEETSYATEDLGFKNYQLKLDGRIGLGFNATLNDRLIKSGYARFKVDGDIITVPLTEATAEADGTYTVFCPLTSVQMGKNVKAQLFYADGTPANNVSETTAERYISDLLESDASSEIKVLATAMKNYTAFAEDFFAGNEITDTAYDNVTADEAYDFAETGSAEGVEFYGYDLVLNDGTDLRLYFKANTAPTFTVGGETAEAKEYVDGYYYVTIKNIAAHELNKMFTVVANGTLEVKACALSYANSVISANYNENLVKLCKALYNYSNMAANYAASN